MHPHHAENYHAVGDVSFHADCLLSSPQDYTEDSQFDTYRKYVNVYDAADGYIIVQGFRHESEHSYDSATQINLCITYKEIVNVMYRFLTPQVIDFLAELEGIL